MLSYIVLSRYQCIVTHLLNILTHVFFDQHGAGETTWTSKQRGGPSHISATPAGHY